MDVTASPERLIVVTQKDVHMSHVAWLLKQFLFLHKVIHIWFSMTHACGSAVRTNKKEFVFHFVSKCEPQKQSQQFVKTEQLHAVWHDAVFKDFAGF